MASRRRLPGLLAPAAVLSLALLGTSCGADGTDASPAAPFTPATEGSPAAPADADDSAAATDASPATVGTDAPAPAAPAATAAPAALQFQAPLVGGGSFEGSEYGARPVAFWFWAPT